jgi:hypothetical protein
MRLEGTNVLLQWPVTSTQDLMEESATLEPGEEAWSPFGGTVARRGNTYAAVVAAGGVARFFRIRRE